MYDWGEEAPGWSSVAAVGMSLGSGVEWLFDRVDGDRNNTFARASSAITSGVSETIDSKTGKFLYNTGMSMAESAASSVLGPAGGVLLGLSAAAQATNDAYDRGLDDTHAVSTGIAAGLAEMIFESISIGKFKKMQEIASPQGKEILKNLAKTTLTNCTEELATEIANIGADFVINNTISEDDFSEYSTSVRMYQNQGYTPDKAKNKALGDLGTRIAEAAASGALMGMGFGTLGQSGAIRANIANRRDYRALVRDAAIDNYYAEQYQGDIPGLVDQALEINPGNQAAKDAKEKLDNGVELSPQEIRQLAEPVVAANMEATAAGRLQDLGESGDMAAISKAAVKSATGQKLTADEKAALKNSQHSEQVVKELKEAHKKEQSAIDAYVKDSVKKARQFDKAVRKAIKNADKPTEDAEAQPDTPPEGTITEDQIDAIINDEAALAQLVQETGIELPDTDAGKRAAIKEAVAKLAQQRTSDQNSQTPDTVDSPTETPTEGQYEAAADGVTTMKSTGDPVKIKEIASIKKGKMTLRLEDGSEVDARDVLYGSEDEALIYETVAKLCTHHKAAQLLVDAFHTADVPAYEYTKGIIEAHGYGKYNFSESEMMTRGSFVKYLTPHQRKAAYEVGQIFGGRETAREHAAVRRPKDSKANIKDGKVHFEGDRSKLNETQKSSLDALEMLSKALGVQIYIFESATDTDGKHTGKNGWYDLRDGSIHIDLNAGMDGKGTMLYTAAHELTHFIRQWSPAKFKVLANFLISQYYAKGVSVQELIDGQIAKAKRDGRTLDRDAAYEEVVADSMETMLNDGNVLQQLAELRQRDKTLWEKIRGWFKDFANKLKAVIKAYDGAKPDSVEGRLVSDMQGVVEILEALYVDALTDASANYAAGAKKNTAGGGVKYQAKNNARTFTYQELIAKKDFSVQVIKSNRTVKLTNDGSIDKNWIVSHVFRQCQSVQTKAPTPTYFVNVPDIGKNVKIVEKGITHGFIKSEAKNGKAVPPRSLINARAALDLPQILRTSIEVNRSDRGDNKEVDFSHVLIGVTAMEDANGKIDFYAVRSVVESRKNVGAILTEANVIGKLHAMNAKKIGTPHAQVSGNNTALTRSSLFRYSVADMLNDVKTDFNDTFSDDVYAHFGMQRRSNEFSDYLKYSTRDQAAQKIQQALEKENAQLKEDVAYLKELIALQKTVTGGTKFTKTSVTAAAQMLKKNANAKGDTKELAALLNTFYEYVATEKELSWERVKEQAQPAVQWLQEHTVIKPDTSRVEYEYNRDLIAMDLLQDVYDSYWRVSAMRTFADSMQKKINVLRYKHKQQMSKLRSEKNDQIDALKAEYRAELERIGRASRAETEAKVRDIKSTYQASREKTIDSRKRYEMRMKIRKDIRDLTKMLRRGKDDRNVKEEMKDLVSTTIAQGEAIFIDYYTDDDIIRNGVTVDVYAEQSAMMNEANDILKQLDQPEPEGIHEDPGAWAVWDADQRHLKSRLSWLKSKLKEVFVKERNRMDSTLASTLLDGVYKAYKKLATAEMDYVRNAYDPQVLEYLKGIQDRFENVKARDMSLRQLEDLHKAYTMVLHTVRNANKAFTESRSVEQLAKQLVSELKGKRKIPKNQLMTMARNAADMVGWNYEKLYYALERVGSETMTRLFNNLANSENIVMQDAMDAKAAMLDLIDKYGYNTWGVNKQFDQEFVDNRGKTFRLTLGEMMLLYAYVRRGTVNKQLETGGFVFGKKSLVEELTNTTKANAYKLTRDQCINITSLLTDKQKRFVESMQDYLSDVMGAKGNEVSMRLYGVELFTEKHYMPVHVAGEYHSRADEAQAKAAAGFASMKNAGFTNSKNVEATAPIVLESLMDVWVDHVNEMSRYHGTVPALEDIRRVMNYSVYNDAETDSVSVQAALENSFGKAAVNYFDSLYREANSGAVMDKLQGISKQALTKMRKLGVAYSLSVIIQQPASLVRAYAMIDKKYFGNIRIPGLRGNGTLPIAVVKTALNKWTQTQSKAYAEMLKYAPGVTMAKEIGGFDTASGSSIRTYLMDTEKSVGQKLKTGTGTEKAKAVADLVDDNPIANIPNLADKMTWIEIWHACKRECAVKYKSLSTEAYMQKVGERFTEVIRATQVYDSIFAKSPMLKSKNLAVQYMVSFMNEPNVVANMAESAIRDLRNGDVKKGVKKMAVLARAVIFTSVLKSLIYAMRDDDENETYIEKYVQALCNNLVGDLTGFNYIPFVSDIWSIIQGYDVERPDLAIYKDLVDDIRKYSKIHEKDISDMSTEELEEWERSCTAASWSLVGSIAGCLGIPVKNVTREVKAVFNTVKTCSNGLEMTDETFWDAMWQGVSDELPWVDGEKNTDKLYQAIIEENEAYLERLQQRYLDGEGKLKENSYTTAIRKALRENDPRIEDAARSRRSGDTGEYLRIVEEIVAEGNFDEEDVVAAVRTAYNKLKGEDSHNKLYDAMLADDDAAVEELKGNYINDKGEFSDTSYHSAIQKGLRENDSRIKKAAEAKASGDTDAYLEIVEEIVEEGHFKWKDVSAAVKDEVKEMEED
jgi:hypothetical protein